MNGCCGMPEVNSRPRKQIVALAMFISAAVMFALSMMFYTRVIDLGELRLVAAAMVGVAAIADLLIAIWFFRQGQSL